MSSSSQILSTDEDPFAELDNFHRECHARYDRIRGRGVAFSRTFNAWIIFKHNLLRDFLANAEAFPILAMGQDAPEPARTFFRTTMLGNNGEPHVRPRLMVQGYFSGPSVKRLEAKIEQIVDEELAHIVGHGEMDAVSQFSFRVPVRVIADIFGLPLERVDDFSAWGSWILKIGDPSFDHRPHSAEIAAAFEGQIEFLREEIERRRKQPGEDLISHIVRKQQTESWIAFDDIWVLIATVLTAGHETTTNLIANGIRTLLMNPVELIRLKSDEASYDRACTEIARYEGAASISVPRIAREDIRLGPASIAAGDTVVGCIQSANRDPEVFANPHEFDIRREETSSISFGYGPHFCLGAQLARLETRIALRRLFERLPNLRADADELVNPRWRPLMQTRGFEGLHVYAS